MCFVSHCLSCFGVTNFVHNFAINALEFGNDFDIVG